MNISNKVFAVTITTKIEGNFPFAGTKEFPTYGAAKAEFTDICDSLNIDEPQDISEDYAEFTASNEEFIIEMKSI